MKSTRFYRASWLRGAPPEMKQLWSGSTVHLRWCFCFARSKKNGVSFPSRTIELLIGSRVASKSGNHFIIKSIGLTIAAARRQVKGFNNLFNNIACDYFRPRRVAVQQRVVADVIHDSRDALRHVADQSDRRVIKQIHVLRARLLQSKADVLIYLEQAERLHIAAQRYALLELAKRRPVQELVQFRLARQHNL